MFDVNDLDEHSHSHTHISFFLPGCVENKRNNKKSVTDLIKTNKTELIKKFSLT